MAFVDDVTTGEGKYIPPDTQFVKTWHIWNSGAEAWNINLAPSSDTNNLLVVTYSKAGTLGEQRRSGVSLRFCATLPGKIDS